MRSAINAGSLFQLGIYREYFLFVSHIHSKTSVISFKMIFTFLNLCIRLSVDDGVSLIFSVKYFILFLHETV
jgi:hypothetical protein